MEIAIDNPPPKKLSKVVDKFPPSGKKRHEQSS